MSESDKTDLLMGLGLSPNQAKVYQTILKLGNVPVVLIAKSSSVRREDVYKVLPTLEKMGLIEKLLGKIYSLMLFKVILIFDEAGLI